jgi:hypothetical protein
MGTADIYVKTTLGLQEVSSRKLKLHSRLRCMLILVDGRHPVSRLLQEAQKLGSPDDFVDQLVALDLIVLKEGASTSAASVASQAVAVASTGDEFSQFRAAKEFMNTTVVDALGIKSFFFTLKLEKCGTRADLAALVPDYGKALTKTMGPEGAQVMVERLESLLR